MKTIFFLMLAVFVVAGTCVVDSAPKQPAISINASLVTDSGNPRVFETPSGAIQWTPSLPVYKGDRLTVAFNPENGLQPYRVTVKLDNRSFADLRNPPWKVLVDTVNLSPGKHVLRADIRFPGTPRMYSIADFEFYVRDAMVQVKGTVQEMGTVVNGRGPDTLLAGPVPKFTPPTEDAVKHDIQVTLRSLDAQADKALAAHEELIVNRPVVFKLDAKPGVDRWAYAIMRDGKQIAGGGPVSRAVYLEIAPKGSGEIGLLPGKLTLRAWGIRNDGAYSRPVEVSLFVER